MKNSSTSKFLYELPAMAPFTYSKQKYRTITELKSTVITRARAGQKREVLNLSTNKAERIPFFTKVTIQA